MFWTIANTLTIVFDRACGFPNLLPESRRTPLATLLLVGALTIWAFLGIIIFEFMTETAAWGALGGDDRVHAFMAPLSRLVHLVRAGRVRGALRARPGGTILFFVVAARESGSTHRT